MPIDRFWLLEKNISRIEAANSLRRLDAAVASQSEKGYKEYHGMLEREIGTVMVDAPKFDRKGYDALKRLNQGPPK